MEQNFRYDSRYDSEHKQHIQETVEYILSLDYGTTIRLETLGKLMHYNLDNELECKKFKSSMCRVRNFLIEYGYVLKSITNIGYYILKPNQISGYCYHTYIRHTFGLLEKSDRILKHVDTLKLSEVRKKEHKEVCELNKDTINAIDTTIENSAYYYNKNTYNNLED